MEADGLDLSARVKADACERSERSQRTDGRRASIIQIEAVLRRDGIRHREFYTLRTSGHYTECEIYTHPSLGISSYLSI